MNAAVIRNVALAATFSAILMLSIGYYWPIQDAYHPRNFEWNGCSKIASVPQNMTILLSYDMPLPKRSSLLAIIGPSIEFSKKETSYVISFLQAGGTVLLADDAGTGNGLLETLNVPARFSGKPIADLLYYSKDPSFPLITDFLPSPVSANITTLVLNHPSYIDIRNQSQVTELASSSSFSSLDLNGGGRPTANETVDSYPVLASATIGKGSIVLVSDPRMFSNEMIDLYDNMQIFRNILKMGQDTLFFDVSHLAKAPLTNERMTLRNTIDSIRDSTIYSRNDIYIQFLVVAVLITGFSFQILKKARKMNNQSLYSNFEVDLKR